MERDGRSGSRDFGAGAKGFGGLEVADDVEDDVEDRVLDLGGRLNARAFDFGGILDFLVAVLKVELLLSRWSQLLSRMWRL